MTFNRGAVGSSPTGLTKAFMALRRLGISRRRRVPRPSPEITPGRGRSPRKIRPSGFMGR